MMPPEIRASMALVEESRRNFIVFRMEKFGETEEQAEQLYSRLVFIMALRVLPKALNMLKAYKP